MTPDFSHIYIKYLKTTPISNNARNPIISMHLASLEELTRQSRVVWGIVIVLVRDLQSLVEDTIKMGGISSVLRPALPTYVNGVVAFSSEETHIKISLVLSHSFL